MTCRLHEQQLRKFAKDKSNHEISTIYVYPIAIVNCQQRIDANLLHIWNEIYRKRERERRFLRFDQQKKNGR